jgi:hypothetical protein
MSNYYYYYGCLELTIKKKIFSKNSTKDDTPFSLFSPSSSPSLSSSSPSTKLLLMLSDPQSTYDVIKKKLPSEISDLYLLLIGLCLKYRNDLEFQI